MTDPFGLIDRHVPGHKRYLIRVVKDQAEQLYHSLNEVDSREMAIARTKLEEAVMWASKGIKG